MRVDFRSRLEMGWKGWEQGEGPNCCAAGDVCDSEGFFRRDVAGEGDAGV